MMDFELDQEQNDIKKAAMEFAVGEFGPGVAPEAERQPRFPLEILKKASRLGFIGMHFPERYGGQDMGVFENALVVEQFCRQHSTVGTALSLADFGSEIVLRFGSDNQKQRLLPKITEGEGISSLAYLEGDQKTGFTPLNTVAVKNDNGFRVNGKKYFVANGSLSGSMIVLCKIKGSESAEQVLIIVDKDDERLQVSSPNVWLGLNMVPLCTYDFHDVDVSYDDVIGNGEKTDFHFSHFLNEMRIERAAMGVGIAQGAFDLALRYARQRSQFGQRICSFYAVRNKLIDMTSRIEMSRLLTYQAAVNFDRNKASEKACCMAGLVSAETAFDVANDALQIFGGYGYIVENQIEHFFRDARIMSIFGESEEVLKSIMGDRIGCG